MQKDLKKINGRIGDGNGEHNNNPPFSNPQTNFLFCLVWWGPTAQNKQTKKKPKLQHKLH